MAEFGRRRTRSFLEEDVEAEENIRKLAAAASMNGAVSRGASEGGRGRGRSTSFHVEDGSDTTEDSSSGSDSDNSRNSTDSNGSNSSNESSGSGKKKKKKSKRQVSKKTRDIWMCEKLKEETRNAPESAVDKAERKLRDEVSRRPKGTSPNKGRTRNNKKKGDKQPYDQLVKLLLLGDSGVGKTCLLTRFADKKYSPSLVTTAGIDFKVKYFEINGVKVKCQIWDTAGQERFHVITKAFYKGAHGIALVYDVTDRKTLDNIDYWLGNIADHAQDSVERVLIGNKVDLPRAINTEEGESVASARNIKYLETSAKTGTNVQQGKNVIFCRNCLTVTLLHLFETKNKE